MAGLGGRRDRGLGRLRRDRRSRLDASDRRADRRRRDARPRQCDARVPRPREPARAGRRARGDPADGRRAVEHLPRARREARAEALPPPRAGNEPGTGAAPLPDRAGLPADRRARGLGLLRGPSARGDAGDLAALRPLAGRRVVARAGDDRLRPGLAAGPRPPPRRGDRGAAQRARVRSRRSALRPGGAEQRGAGASLRLDRRGDRAGLRRSPTCPRWRRSPAAARMCGTACAR